MQFNTYSFILCFLPVFLKCYFVGGNIYNNDQECILEYSIQNSQLNDEWYQYIIDISGIDGEGYIDFIVENTNESEKSDFL